MVSKPDIDSFLEMEAFDRLPGALKDYLRSARGHLSAVDVLNLFHGYAGSVNMVIAHLEGDIDAAFAEDRRDLNRGSARRVRTLWGR